MVFSRFRSRAPGRTTRAARPGDFIRRMQCLLATFLASGGHPVVDCCIDGRRLEINVVAFSTPLSTAVVVGNRPFPLIIINGGPDRARQLDEEVLVSFLPRITTNGDGNGFGKIQAMWRRLLVPILGRV